MLPEDSLHRYRYRWSDLFWFTLEQETARRVDAVPQVILEDLRRVVLTFVWGYEQAEALQEREPGALGS
eukprot:scaffold8232_cov31-Tisochrysis_lutea.AAC.1